eukprot:Seg390.2 transcript_id=Seg390.2/GoldUCD/mRNA.D3Y31 product="hypothetical protein" protein_id=Seg390.2/GoldUCD/D3Y31
MDKETNSNVKLILKALEIIKENGTGQYLENICELCKNEFGWDAEKTKLALDEAKKENVIHEFKRFIHSEILALKAQTASRSNDHPHDIDVYAKALIRSLEDRIRSLERQLEQKQAIIEKLLDGPRQIVCTQSTPNPLGAEEVRNSNLDTKENNKSSTPTIETTNQTKGDKETTTESNKANSEEIQRNNRKVTIIGDSIVNGSAERGLGKKHIVKIRKHPGGNNNRHERLHQASATTET